MISTYGLPANLALKIIDRERDKFNASIEKDALNAREISAFRERISGIQTVDELVGDYEVYSFVMKAFDLESQIFGKALMKKILSSDSKDKTSLISKMTDTRFKEIYAALGFENEGKTNPNTKDPKWVEEMVGKYVEQKLINGQLASNEIVGTVLHVQSKADTISTWYKVLADKTLQNFFYTALGFPDDMKGTDVDRQVATLQKKFDLETLTDPGVLDGLTKRYAARAQANEAQANLSSNPILQLFGGSSQQQQSIIEISLSGMSALRGGRY